MLTKAQYRTITRQYLDDPSAKRWSDANLDLVITFVLDDIWCDMLDTAPYLTCMYQQIGLPLRAPGYVDLRQTVNGGDLTQRFYRLQQLIADGRHYFAKDPRDFLMVANQQTGDVSTIQASTGVEQRFSYQFIGDQLWLHPLGNVTTFVEMRYSFRPMQFNLNAEGTPIPFPEGSEHYVPLTAAAHAMAKGNSEDAGQLNMLAQAAKTRLIDSIRRQYHGPTVPFTPSNQWEMGGI